MEWISKITTTIANWTNAQNEKKINKNRDKGTCPDCSGKGIDPIVFHGGTFIDPQHFHCPSCHGSGLFSDWEATQLK